MFNNVDLFNYVKEKDLSLVLLERKSEKKEIFSNTLQYYVVKNDIKLLNGISSLLCEKDLKSKVNDFFSIFSLRERPQLYPTFSKEDVAFSSDLSKDHVFISPLLENQTTPEDDVNKFIVNSSEELITVLNETMNSIVSLYPEQYSAFLPVVDKLNAIMTSLPSISEDEIKTLNQLPAETYSLMVNQNLPLTFRSAFWNSVQTTYTNIVNNSKDLSVTLSQDLQNAQNQQDLFNEVQQSISEFLLFVSPGSNQNALTITDISQMLQLLMFIGNVFSSLDENEQNLINNTLTPTVNRECYNANQMAFTLGDVLADVWAYNIVSVFLSEDPKMTQSALQESVSNMMASYKTSLFSPIEKMANAVLDIVQSFGQGVVGSIYSFSADGQLVMASQFINSVISSPGYINNSSLSSLEANQNSGIVFNLEASQIVSQNTINLNTLQNAAIQLTNFVAIQTESLSNSRGQSLLFLPLPSAIASVLLDHYMPEEVDYLQTLSDNLYYSNMGSKMGGAVLETISNYINSGSFFNFASMVGNPITTNGKTSFSGNATSAENRLKLEIQQTKSYITTTKQALEVIEQQITAIQSDTKLSPSEKNQLISVLNKNKNSFNNILSNLVAAQSLLNQLQVVPDGSGENTGSFQITGPSNWQSDLQNLETSLVTGSNGNGGMFSTITNLQATQQSFADDGQNKQLELQLHLTTMQQEWTVIATSLQILNQIYLGLARNIIQ